MSISSGRTHSSAIQEFGLPIQFRFAPKDSGKDPDPVTLLPKGKDRK
ncbi:hypothetical protein [Bacillus altitudinis]